MQNLDKIVDLITDRLMEKLELEYYKPSVYIVGKNHFPDILKHDGYQVVKDSSIADIILIESIAFDAFLRISSLCPLTIEEAIIIKNLLKGKRVLAASNLFEIQKYQKSSNNLMYQELKKKYDNLIQYGIQFYKKEDLLATLESSGTGCNIRNYNETKGKNNPKIVSKTSLLTEKKLIEMNLSENESIKIDKGMIVTALAKDYLKRHNIKIEG